MKAARARQTPAIGVPSKFHWTKVVSPWRALREQRRPCGIGSEARRRDPLFVASGEIDGVERGTRGAARIAEEHDHATVRGEGRPLVVEAFGQDALAGAVGLDDADRETAAALLGERDDGPAARPHPPRPATP